jgi:hypothetical protein
VQRSEEQMLISRRNRRKLEKARTMTVNRSYDRLTDKTAGCNIADDIDDDGDDDADSDINDFKDENKIIIEQSELDALDTSNIIPRGRRRAALASGLVAPASSSSSSSAAAAAPRKSHTIKLDDDEEEAEF